MYTLGFILTVGLAIAACSKPSAAPTDTSAATDGTVVDVDGESHKLASAWSRGPAVVVFYRGFW